MLSVNTGNTSSSPRHILHHCGPIPVHTKASFGVVGSVRPVSICPVGEGLKLFSRFGDAVGDHRVPMVQVSAPLTERVAQIRQRDIGTVAKCSAKPTGRRDQRLLAARRDRQDGQRRWRGVALSRAARAGGSASTTWALVPPNPNEFTPTTRRSQAGNGRPVVGDVDLEVREARRRWWVRQMQIGRDVAVLEHQRRLDQPGHACAGLEVADVGLDRSDEERVRPARSSVSALDSARISMGSPRGVPVPCAST